MTNLTLTSGTFAGMSTNYLYVEGTEGAVSHFSNAGGVTCNGSACVAGGEFAGVPSVTFPVFSGGSNITSPATIGPGTYNTVTVGNNQTITISSAAGGTINISTLNLNGAGNPATIAIDGHTYNIYIKAITSPAGNSAITIASGGIARFFVNSSVSFSLRAAAWNTGGTARQLMFYSVGSGNTLTINNANFQMNGILMADGTLTLSRTQSPGITGAVLTNIGTMANSNITYSAAEVNAANYGPISCKGPANQLVVTGLSSGQCYGTPFTFTVTPTNVDSLTDSTYQRTIVLDTNNGTCTPAGGAGCFGTWTLANGAGTFTPGSANSGYATYTYVVADGASPPQFTMNYPNTGLASPVFKIYEKNVTPVQIPAFSQTLNFSGGGATTLTWSTTSPQVGNVNFSPAATLTATGGGACGSGGYTGTKNTLKFWSTYTNPASGTVKVTIGGTPIGTSAATGTIIPGIVFNASSVATLPNINYADVGSITLSVIDTASGGPTCGGSCTSSPIVVQPSAFVISGTGIPGCNTPTACSVFTQAGTAFTAVVTGTVSGGAAAPNYGNETPQQTPVLTAALSAPAGGTFGAFNAGTATFAGSGTGKFNMSNISYGEVGAITLKASTSSGQYLSTVLPAGASPTVIVGRFQPHHFATTANAPSFTAACSTDGFSYFGQSNAYATAPVLTVTAQNASNATTLNYNGTWAFLTPSSMNTSSVYSQTTTTTSGTPSISGTVPNPAQAFISNGVQSFTYGGTISLPQPALASSTPYPGPFIPNIALSIAVQDADSPVVKGSPNSCILSGPGAANSCAAGGTGVLFSGGLNTFYQGRLALFDTAASNIVGSTAMVPVQVQYYTTSGGFTVNSLDSHCTSLTGTNYCFNSTAPCAIAPPQPVSPSSVTLPGTLTTGAGFIMLGAPSPQATGQTNFAALIDASHQNLPWLQSNWGAGTYANPQAQISWGFFPGSSRVIYQQENYN